MAYQQQEKICKNLYSQTVTNVTEFSEFQSRISTNIAQNNSELLDMNMTYKEMAGKELQRGNLRLMDAENINVFLYKKCNGTMGVPISFLDKYCPEQFELLGITDRQNTSGLRNKKYTVEDSPKFNDLNARGVLKFANKEYKQIYARILIRYKGD